MTQILALLIPLSAIVLGIGIGMLSIYLDYRKRKEMFALYHQERMAAIDKGIELPPLPEAFFAGDGGKPSSPHAKLLGGLILVSIGLALFVALYFNTRVSVALYALIPAAIGLAMLIYYFTVGRKEAEAIEAATKERAAAALCPPRT